jgi:hypothetical protein
MPKTRCRSVASTQGARALLRPTSASLRRNGRLAAGRDAWGGVCPRQSLGRRVYLGPPERPRSLVGERDLFATLRFAGPTVGAMDHGEASAVRFRCSRRLAATHHVLP